MHLKRAVGFFAQQVARSLDEGLVPVEVQASREEDNEVLVTTLTRGGSVLNAVVLPVSECGTDLAEIEQAFTFAMGMVRALHAGRSSKATGRGFFS